MNKTQITLEDMASYFQRGRSMITVPTKALSPRIVQPLITLGAKQYERTAVARRFSELGLYEHGKEDVPVLVPTGLLEEFKTANMDLIDIEKETFHAVRLTMELPTKDGATTKRSKI
ncbi:hypothetical protein [Burkholderia sp. LMG 13014]|uniref:hypothetical protein n=1 Tax=Burkholderia sp. LMG 13014 TaxID=2709306 RepID=UPI0019641DF1|nr:hypothetical protein [Burkholderia sp. LMG 13014]